jgi:hypothetical protein
MMRAFRDTEVNFLFIIHLLNDVFNFSDYKHRIIGRLVDEQLEGIWKEVAVVARCETLARSWPGGTKENLSQDRMSPGVI